MAGKEFLTNELLSKRFNGSFELVKYAVRLAKNMIRTGRGSRVPTHIQNRAYQVLLEIAEGKDHIDDLPQQTDEQVLAAPHFADILKKASERRKNVLLNG